MGQRKQIRQTDKRTGRVYVYETEFVYDEAKKKTMLKGRKLIGHVDPDTGEVVANRPTKARLSSPQTKRLYYGATYLIDAICAKAGIAEDLKRAAPELSDAALSLAYYLVIEDESPMLRFKRFSDTHVHPFGGPLPSQRASELLASLDEGIKERFLELQAKRRPDSEYWFYDTTSISSYSEALRCVRWGRNKDHMPLAQINLAVLLGDGSGMPFYFRRIPGNISDVSTVKKLIADMPYLSAGKVRIACDRGFYSAKNINAMMEAHMKFLIGTKCSLKLVSGALAANKEDLHNWRNYDKDKAVFGLKVPVEWDFEAERPRKGTLDNKAKKRAYLHLYYSPERAALEEGELAALLKALSAELEADNRIEGHSALYDTYFKRERGGIWAGRMDVISEARSHYGYFCLLTNDATLTPTRALEIYRNKDGVEKAFCDVKGRLDFRTPKVSSELTLNGKLLVVFISLMIVSWLKRQMALSGLAEKWTLQGLIDEVDTIERYERTGQRPRILEVTKKQREIFEALGIEPPIAS